MKQNPELPGAEELPVVSPNAPATQAGPPAAPPRREDPPSMLALIERIAKDANVETLDRLLAVQERWEANLAKQKFAAAFVAMKPHLPLIAKTHDNEQTRSKYAKLEDINAIVDPILQQYGFGTTDKIVSQSDSLITMRIEIWHSGGHVESTEISMPPDDQGIAGKINKTKPHAIASTITYLRRVGKCALLGISTGDDQDGNLDPGYVTDEQTIEILDLIEKAKVGRKFLAYVKAEPTEITGSLEASVATIPARNYRMAIRTLEEQIAKHREQP